MGIADRLTRRLTRLEDGSGSRLSCTECGQPSNFTHEATHIGSEEAYEAVFESGPEFCEVCLRRVLHPVYFDLHRADTTLPVVVVRVRPKHREEHADH